MAELKLEDWFPMSPLVGPPLPKFLSIYWPWYKEEPPPPPPPEGGLTVTGAKIEASVSPGKDYTYNMKVANTCNWDNPMDIAVEIKGYGMRTDRDFQALEPEEDTSPYTAREFLMADQLSFHLEPGDSKVINITAQIPSAGEGGRYAIVYIHTAPMYWKPGFNYILAIASRVLFTISGFYQNISSEITQVNLAEKTPQELELLVTVANNGNYHYKPKIQAKLLHGDEVVAIASFKADWPLIPYYSRQYSFGFDYQNPFPSNEYKINIEVKDESGNLAAEGTY